MGNMKKRAPLLAGIICGVLILAGIITFLLWFFRPQLVLKEDVTIEAGTILSTDLLVVEVKNGEWDDIRVTTEADTNKAGTYPVALAIGSEVYEMTITVEDTTPPTLILHTPGIIAFAEAMPTYDIILAMVETEVDDVQDVTISLEELPADLTEPGVYDVTVVATDASGNRTTLPMQLTIEEPDTIAPVISGVTNTSISVGSSFDPLAGVSVKDDKDPDPMLLVDDSALNLNESGTYTLIYTATDVSGNKATAKRTITVTPKPYIYTSAGGATWNAAGIKNQPYLVAVNRAMCTVTVYGKDENNNYTVPLKAFACSVGRSGHSTPLLQVSSLDRYRWCCMVDGTWGQYAIRVRGGIMFHSVPYYTCDASDLEYDEYNKLGSPASLGCIRMTVKDVKWLYDNCPYGFQTVIYDDTTSPGPLGKPTTQKIDTTNEELRGWDPTDPNKDNPWNK